MKKTILLFSLLLIVSVVFGQDGRDFFSIRWPAEYHWQKFDTETGKKLTVDENETEGNMRHEKFDISLIPEGQNSDNWSIIGSVIKDRPLVEHEVEVTAYTIFYDEQKVSSKAKLIILEKDRRWILFKIQNTSLPGKSTPISKLYYFMNGGYGRTYIATVSVKSDTLSDEFTTKWENIFKARIYHVW